MLSQLKEKLQWLLGALKRGGVGVEHEIEVETETTEITVRHLTPLSDHSWPNNQPDSIVIHTLLGSVEGSEVWLQKKPVSYHYLIAENGEVIEKIPPHRCAWHAGVTDYALEEARKWYGQDNPNTRSIGVAFERNGESFLTEPQVKSGSRLKSYLMRKFEIKKMFSHRDITSYKPEVVEVYAEQIRRA